MYAFVSVRSKSSRLPDKCFLELNGHSVLQHVINRCKFFDIDPVILTTDDNADNKIEQVALNNNILCYRGSSSDKLQRWNEACRIYNITRFVTIDCDDPLFDPALVKTCFAVLNDKNIDAVSPNMNAYLGSNGWGFFASTINAMCDSKKSDKTEMIDKYLLSSMKVETLDVATNKEEKDLRLTLDYKEDYWLLSTVVRELGSMCERQNILRFFKNNPGLRLINEFRNTEWKQHQKLSES